MYSIILFIILFTANTTFYKKYFESLVTYCDLDDYIIM